LGIFHEENIPKGGKQMQESVIGEVISYTEGWNPFSMKTILHAKIPGRVIHIPIDHRQKKFVQKEYPVGSAIELEFNGWWNIRSRPAPPEYDLAHMAGGIY
jgi:hypothetical protein